MSKSVDISKSVNISKPVNKKLLVVVIIGVLLILFSIYYFYKYYKSKPVPIEEIEGLSLNIAEYYLGDEDLIVLARGKLIKEDNEIANEADTQEYKGKLSQEIEFIGYSSSDYKKTKKKLFILPMSLRHFDVYGLRYIDYWHFVENSNNHNRWGLLFYRQSRSNFSYISIRYVSDQNKLECFNTTFLGCRFSESDYNYLTDINSTGTILLMNSYDSISLLDNDLIYCPSLLHISSILDWSRFINSLKNSEAKDKKRIFQLLDDESKKIISAWEYGKKLTDNEKKSLIRGLNTLLKRRDFFDNEVFDSIVVNEEAQELINKGLDNLSKEDIQRLNFLSLKAVYRYSNQIAGSIISLRLLLNRNLDIDDARIKYRFNFYFVHHTKFLDDETIIVLGDGRGVNIAVYSLMDPEKDKKIKIKNYPDLPVGSWDKGFNPLDISPCKSKAAIQTLEPNGVLFSDKCKWLTICDLNTHEIENVVNLGKQRCNHLKFNHIREEIIAAADDNDIRIIDLNKKQVIKTLTNTYSYPNSMQWSPDGKKLGFLSAATWRTNIPYPEEEYFKPAIWVYDLDNDHLEKIDESYDFVGFFWINRN